MGFGLLVNWLFDCLINVFTFNCSFLKALLSSPFLDHSQHLKGKAQRSRKEQLSGSKPQKKREGEKEKGKEGQKKEVKDREGGERKKGRF